MQCRVVVDVEISGKELRLGRVAMLAKFVFPEKLRPLNEDSADRPLN
ncbi:MAG: hypothetical protein IPH36_12790 [Saprospiraceae bacterium]|nr:hypothetical protein [Saprospiraceae bacterium]